MRKLTLGAIALAASMGIGSAASYADLAGAIWLNEVTSATDAEIFNIPQRSPDATFTSTAFDYTGSFNGTVGAFLNNDAMSLSDPAVAGATLGNSYFRFIGNARAPTQGTDNVFITHDDGVQLAVDNIAGTPIIIIDSPFPTSARTDTATLLGDQLIFLSYGECCGGPATLVSNLQNAVPEPATLALLGSALVGFGLMRRRRKTG